MSVIILENARIFDGTSAECAEGQQVLIEQGVIREVSAGRIQSNDAIRLDLRGRTLMPGMIDLHTHAHICDIRVDEVDRAGAAYRTAHAARMLSHILDCGFTTMRDTGGGDFSLARALEDGLLRGPRYYFSGKILSMTGGHGDFRKRGEAGHTDGSYCECGNWNSVCKIIDGADECLKAVREELRLGAHFIKIMGSGGVTSPTSPLWLDGFSDGEMRSIVEECTRWHTYVAAHCHPVSAIRRCVEAGIRSIEHATLIDDETAEFVASSDAFIVPTMSVLDILVKSGAEHGLAPDRQAKADFAYSKAMQGLESMKRAGVSLGFGTDLLGSTYVERGREFLIRREIFDPVDILRQATSIGAKILGQEGKLGCIAPEALADVIVVDGDPLRDIELLAEGGKNIGLIIQAGTIVKNEVGTWHA